MCADPVYHAYVPCHAHCIPMCPLQVIKQVKKLVYVKELSDITSVPYVARELMLVKVGA